MMDEDDPPQQETTRRDDDAGDQPIRRKKKKKTKKSGRTLMVLSFFGGMLLIGGGLVAVIFLMAPERFGAAASSQKSTWLPDAELVKQLTQTVDLGKYQISLPENFSGGGHGPNGGVHAVKGVRNRFLFSARWTASPPGRPTRNAEQG
jgi:hypothetical protein